MKKLYTLLLTGIAFLSANSQALDFDGSDDYVSIPGHSSVMNSSPFTFEVAIKPRQKAGDNMSSIAARGNGNPFYLYIEPMGGMPGPFGSSEPTSWIIMCDLWNTSGQLFRAHYVINSSFYNAWHHLAASYTGTQWILYVDGVAVSSVPASGTIGNYTADPIILGRYQNLPWNFDGTMDEVRIWNTVRTAEEIAANMEKQVSANSAGLIAYYNFNQGVVEANNAAVTSLTDVSATGNNGTLSNFTLNGTGSNFVGGNPEMTTLPLRVTAFSGRGENTSVLLSWKSGELNSFDVERSINGRDFVVIGTVPVNATGAYQFFDHQPHHGTNLYRLSGVTATGKREYSSYIVVKRGTISQMKIYPNPAGSSLQLQVTYRGAQAGSITDLAGKKVLSFSLPVAASFTSFNQTIDISRLSPGIYLLELNGQQVKFMKP